MSGSERSAARVLVTGGNGTLGRHVVAALEARGAAARVLSRRPPPADLPAGREWAQADLAGDALEPALAGVDAAVHLASEKGAGGRDVLATRRLLAAARAAGLRHLAVVSIVGCDRIPLPFYATKLELEAEVRGGGVPWTIVRSAQFRSFVERLVASAAALPIPAPIVADLRFQPVDEREVAEVLVDAALGPPRGDAPDVAGPELLTLGELAAAWLAATRRPATVLPVALGELGPSAFRGPPAPEAWARPVLEAYARALNAPQGARTLGRVRFAEWLARRGATPPTG